MSPAALTLVPLADVDPAAVEALLDRAFGPDRHGRTAYRVRGAARAIPTLSFAAMADDRLIGTIQCWPVMLSADGGGDHPLVMIGPVAVDPAHQRDGIGRRLMRRALDAAAVERLDGALMLIGDPEYYARFFGFDATRTHGWRLPGPVERHRLLARGEAVPATTGMLGPALAAFT